MTTSGHPEDGCLGFSCFWPPGPPWTSPLRLPTICPWPGESLGEHLPGDQSPGGRDLIEGGHREAGVLATEGPPGSGRGERGAGEESGRSPRAGIGWGGCVHEGGVRSKNHPDLRLGHTAQRGQLCCPEPPGAGLSPPRLHCSQGNGVRPPSRGQALSPGLSASLPPPLPQPAATEGPC